MDKMVNQKIKKNFFIYLAEPSLSCGMWDLVSGPGIEPGPPALGVQSLNHWTTKEILRWQILHYGLLKTTVLKYFSQRESRKTSLRR